LRPLRSVPLPRWPARAAQTIQDGRPHPVQADLVKAGPPRRRCAAIIPLFSAITAASAQHEGPRSVRPISRHHGARDHTRSDWAAAMAFDQPVVWLRSAADLEYTNNTRQRRQTGEQAPLRVQHEGVEPIAPVALGLRRPGRSAASKWWRRVVSVGVDFFGSGRGRPCRPCRAGPSTMAAARQSVHASRFEIVMPEANSMSSNCCGMRKAE